MIGGRERERFGEIVKKYERKVNSMNFHHQQALFVFHGFMSYILRHIFMDVR